MYHNEIPELESISSQRYENVFNMSQTEDNGYYFYNLIKSVRLTYDDLDEVYFFKFKVDRVIPYTALSFNIYGTTDLWWLICVINGIDDPVKFVEPGVTLKIIKKQHVSTVIAAIKNQLQ